MYDHVNITKNLQNASFTCLFQEIHSLVSLNFLLGTSILFPVIIYALQKSKGDTLIL